MARLLTDQFHTGVPADRPAIAPAASPAPMPVNGAAIAARAALLAAILVGLAVGTLLALAMADPLQPPPDQAAVLRGMVAIKGLILGVVASLLWWRLGRPIRSLTLLGYGAAAALSAGALGWLWGLSWVPLGSLLFWLGLGAVLFVTHHDQRLFDGADEGRADGT